MNLVKNLLVLVLLTVVAPAISQNKTAMYRPGYFPDRIVLGLGSDQGTRVVNWRVHHGAAPQFIQWDISDASSNLASTIKKEKAHADILSPEGVKAKYCHFTMKGLVAGNTYVYRVGGGDYWSEWFQFKVEPEGDEFSFVYLGDAQNDMRDLWSRSVRMAYTHNPNAALWLHLGDMVDNAANNWEWGEWYYGGGWVMSQVPQIPIPGNHEYVKRNKKPVVNAFWRPAFTLPDHGPEGMEELVYYLDYKNTRFIVLDSRNMLLNDDMAEAQAKWLKKVLKSNNQKWTVVCHHHPVHSARGNRGNYGIEKFLKPIYQKYKVDLVLQGHHHSFARGRSESDRGKEIQSGPVYFVSNSGPKMYDSNFAKWMERVATNVQLFHSIEVKGEELEVYSYLVNGELYDHIKLKKLKNGDKEFTEIRVEGVEERLKFPEASYGADIDKSGDSRKLFEERAKEYLKKREEDK